MVHKQVRQKRLWPLPIFREREHRLVVSGLGGRKQLSLPATILEFAGKVLKAEQNAGNPPKDDAGACLLASLGNIVDHRTSSRRTKVAFHIQSAGGLMSGRSETFYSF
jgi:hypothetical protein